MTGLINRCDMFTGQSQYRNQKVTICHLDIDHTLIVARYVQRSECGQCQGKGQG